jgi:molecular chaperone GrpE (heat shock protein)
MIRKSGYRFSDKIMRQAMCMIRKSGHRFSDKIMRQGMCMIRKSGYRFSDKIMRQTKESGPRAMQSQQIGL